MFSEPRYGWTNITIGDWTDRASYLTNPAEDMLSAMLETLETHKISVCSFDAEGWEYYIIFTPASAIVVELNEDEDGNGIPAKEFFIPIEELAREAINDIRRDIELWSEWDLDDPSDTERKKENAGRLLVLCAKILSQLMIKEKDKGEN